MDVAHHFKYAIHSDNTKLYKDLKKKFYWNGMEKDIAEYVASYLTCQRLTVEHQKLAEMLKLLPILKWKWENINMNFVTGMPKIKTDHDATRMIVNRLTKSAHFLLTFLKNFVEALGKLYVKEIVKLHGF